MVICNEEIDDETQLNYYHHPIEFPTPLTHTRASLTRTHTVTRIHIQTRELNLANDFNGLTDYTGCHIVRGWILM
jgi:hypothetical protein